MGEEFQYDTQLNAFVTIPYSKMTENVLQKENVPHTVSGAEIVVHGNESDRFADLLNVETRRTMDKGLLNPAEPDSLGMLRKIVESLLDPAQGPAEAVFHRAGRAAGSRREPDLSRSHAAPGTRRPGLRSEEHQRRPGGGLLGAGKLQLHRHRHQLRRRTVQRLRGVSVGAGVELLDSASAGDYIDSARAAITGERANRVRIAKEDSFHFNGFFADKLQQALGVYYDEMIQSLVQAMKQAFANSRNLPKPNRPLPIVLSGGTALPSGFRARFEKILMEAELPISTSEIRLAADPLHTSARGALVAALADA